MRYFFYIISFLFFFNVASGQDYVLEYSFKDMLGNKNNAHLIVKGDEAVFKVNDSESNKSGNTIASSTANTFVVNRRNTDELSTFSYTSQDEIFVRIPYTKSKEKEFIYKFYTKSLDWKITDETKQINKYNCQKATLQLHERYYEAWFTTKVPVKIGPFRLNGLPGMIVEVDIFIDKEDKQSIKWQLLSVSNKKKDEVFDFHKQFFTDHKVMDYKTYEKMASEAVLDFKRKKLTKLAALQAKWAKENGYESNARVKYGKDFFTGYLFDLPEGIREELDKLN